jgi:4-hydroxyphenylpyruvate dioxygenase
MPSKLRISTKQLFGFQSLAYAGPETGVRGSGSSYVLNQGKIRIMVLTTPLSSKHPLNDAY